MRAHRWLAFDANFLDNPFTVRLANRFGAAGVVVWVGFLCACKRSPTPGVIQYTSDAHLRRELGILSIDLVDGDGNQWALDDLWTFTGKQKQTSRRRHGGRTHLSSSSWVRWQKDAQTDANTQRMADKRRAQTAHTSRTGRAQKRPDIDIDKDQNLSPPTPSKSADENTPNPPNPKRRGDGTTTRPNGKTADKVIDRVRRCVPGTGLPAATAVVERLRRQGVGDNVIEEAAGYAAEHGGKSALYVEQVAVDWMTQRDPTWTATTDESEPRRIGIILEAEAG